jgi:hypothetical protein
VFACVLQMQCDTEAYLYDTFDRESLGLMQFISTKSGPTFPGEGLKRKRPPAGLQGWQS